MSIKLQSHRSTLFNCFYLITLKNLYFNCSGSFTSQAVFQFFNQFLKSTSYCCWLNLTCNKLIYISYSIRTIFRQQDSYNSFYFLLWTSKKITVFYTRGNQFKLYFVNVWSRKKKYSCLKKYNDLLRLETSNFSLDSVFLVFSLLCILLKIWLTPLISSEVKTWQSCFEGLLMVLS